MSTEPITGLESTTLTTLSAKSTTQTTDPMDVMNELITLKPIIFVEVNPVIIPSTAIPTTSSTDPTGETTVIDPMLVSISSPSKLDAETTTEALSQGFKRPDQLMTLIWMVCLNQHLFQTLF